MSWVPSEPAPQRSPHWLRSGWRTRYAPWYRPREVRDRRCRPQGPHAMDFALALHQRAPCIRIAFHATALVDLQAQLERGILDLALVNSINVPESLRTRLLFTETYVAITAPASAG